jgi:hypothetical protein
LDRAARELSFSQVSSSVKLNFMIIFNYLVVFSWNPLIHVYFTR